MIAPGSTLPGQLLLIDDDALLRRMAARTLRHAGYVVAEAADGEQGLACFTEMPPDLVLLDLEMPGLGGLEVCRRLRATAAGAAVPILILSGHQDEASKASAGEQGATDFITKPIAWPELAARVRSALQAGHCCGAEERGPRLAGRVLLATRGSADEAALGDALGEAGLTVTPVASGGQAIQAALQADFDLVLIGADLPEVDGEAATRMLRACGWRSPIVGLTAQAAPDLLERLRQAGCNLVLALPVQAPELRRLLAVQLGASRAARREIDDPAYRLEVAQHTATFRAALPARIEAVRQALGAQDWPALRSQVHTLKGSAGSFGLGPLSELAGLIEAELRSQRTAGVPALCEQLFSATAQALAPIG